MKKTKQERIFALPPLHFSDCPLASPLNFVSNSVFLGACATPTRFDAHVMASLQNFFFCKKTKEWHFRFDSIFIEIVDEDGAESGEQMFAFFKNFLNE